MLVTRVSLPRASSRPTQPEAEMIKDALWAHVAPADSVEHITAIAMRDSVEIVVFLSSQAEDPGRCARELFERTAAASPAFTAWEPSSATGTM